MSGSAPWSVKGIDPRAREAAREAARARGLTIGEWLNQAILANEAALAAARRDVGAAARAEGETGARDELLGEALAHLAERVDVNDRRAALAIGHVDRSLTEIGKRIAAAGLAVDVDGGHIDDLLTELREAQSALLARMANLEAEEIAGLKADSEDQADQLNLVEENLAQLAARAARSQADTGDALRALETSLASLDEKLMRTGADVDESEFDARLSAIADSLSAQVEDARAEFVGEIAARLGDLKPEELQGALGDLSKRIATAERRHAQTIEAVSIEIRRLNEAMENRLRAVEARNDDGVAAREQISQIAQSVDQRLSHIETRDGAVFTRMSEEVGRIADRLESRVAASENRNAEAIEQVGEQVAIMAERMHERQDRLVADVSDRLAESEERQTSRLSDALSSLSSYLDEIETRSASANPVQTAMSAFNARLAAIETRVGSAKTSAAGDASAGEEMKSAAPSAAPISVAAIGPSDAPPAAPAASVPAPAASIPTPAASIPAPAPVGAAGDPPVDDETLAHHHQALKEMATQLAAPPAGIEDDFSRDEIFVEDIEARFARHDQNQFETPAAPTASDPFADIERAPAAEDDDDDLFWATGETGETDTRRASPAPLGSDDDDEMFADDGRRHATPLGDTAEDAFEDSDAEDDDLGFDRALDLDAGPSARPDYLFTARQAALAQAQAAAAHGRSSQAQSASHLRGMTRVMVWTAAGAVVAALAGGAYYYTTHMGAVQETRVRPVAPLATPPPPADAPPGSIAEAAARAAAVNPDASSAAAPGSPALAAPETAPADQTTSTRDPARAGAAHAGPLSPQAMIAPRTILASASVAAVTVEDAAARGDAVAQYELALQRLNEANPSAAVTLLRRAAQQGLAMAQYRLAKLYEHGDGVPADLVEARRWTERAAHAGNSKAMHDLGVYLAGGEGADLDEQGAFRWFRQAAEQGVADSQYNLGILYLQGRGVAADPARAYYWFTIAAQGGDQDAGARAAMIEKQFPIGQTRSIRADARKFRPKALMARANGDFGERAWAVSPTLQASAASSPKT